MNRAASYIVYGSLGILLVPSTACAQPTAAETGRETQRASQNIPVASSDPSSRRELVRTFWNVEDGLPQSTPRAITQTRDGYLWVGTFNGLARFDGIRFTSYTVANTPELVSDGISVLREDRDGRLWIGTRAGGLVFYRNGRFASVHADDGVSPTEITCLLEAPDGTLWVGTGQGLYRHRGGKLARVPIPSLAAHEPITGLSLAEDGSLWLGTQIRVVSVRDGALVHSVPTPKSVYTITGDRAGNVWVVFEAGGLARIETRTATLTPQPFASRPNAIHEGREGVLWFGTFHGDIREATGAQRTNFLQRLRLSERGVTALFQDREGNWWAGVTDTGLCRLREKTVHMYASKDGLETASIASLWQDRSGRIWVGTFGKGLHRWNGAGFEQVPVGSGVFNITTLAETPDGAMWLGTFGGNMYRRRGTDDFQVAWEMGIRFRASYADRQGGLWLAHERGGCQYHKDGEVTSFTSRDGLANDHVFAFAQDARGDVWIGTLQGLSRVRDGKIDSFTREDGLGGNEIQALFVDSRGVLWAGSSGGGLTRHENGRFTALHSQHGLVNNRIVQIIEDDDANLWLGSGAGIMRIQLAELDDFAAGRRDSVHPAVFRREEGMGSIESGSGFQPSCLKTREGQLWFATGSGIAVIDPKYIGTPSAPPPLHIEQLVVDGRILDSASRDGEEPGSGTPAARPPVISRIAIPPGPQRIEFRYTGVDLTAPGTVRFQYRLEGFDADWIHAGSRREATYTRVPPGQYRFHVRAANHQGNWSETGAVLAIEVLPFYWQTNIFRITLAAAWLGAVVLGGRWFLILRQRRMVAAMERRHALERERARIAHDVHDSLGANLVKISLLGDMIEGRFEDAHSRSQLRRITQTAREAVRDMDEIVWAVNPKHDTLDSLAGYLGQFAGEQFEQTSVDCHLDIPRTLPALPLTAEVRHNLFLATKEALNNVLKHSQARDVWLRLELEHAMLVLTVEDNGRGFPPERKPGDGLENMRERLRDIGGQLDIESTPGAGTKVKFTWPLAN